MREQEGLNSLSDFVIALLGQLSINATSAGLFLSNRYPNYLVPKS